MGVWQTPDDHRLRSVPGALGQEVVVEGHRLVVSHILGQGLLGRRSGGGVGA